MTLFFTALGLAVMGYHPGLEDDGVYLTAVKSKLNPALYPHDANFFRVQLQATFFDKWVAGFVRWTGVPVAGAELLLQFASIALIVFACWAIARKLFPEARAQWAGVALVSAMFTLPVAGTALYLVDQHLHPRALATGFILLAVSRILEGKKWQAVPFLLIAFVMHPIMAAMSVSFCIFLSLTMMEQAPAWLRSWRRPAHSSLAIAFVPLGWVFEPPTPAWREAVNMHTSLCLYRWAWYEWLGAWAPLVLFWLLWRIAQKRSERLLARFALAVFLYAVFQLAVAMIISGIPALVRLAPMQPMRFLHLVYVFMALMGGCLLGKYLLKASLWRWAVFLVAINAGMFAAQRIQFSGSEHLELPGRASANPWLQAFAWIRQNTPTDAYFALDPEYLAAPGEDYHSFRALAERSQLADNIKDAAVVTQVPELGEVWTRQVQAQKGWNRFELADFERLKAEFGVDWVLVAYPQPAGLACEWHNDIVLVCRIP
ncbi:MAG: hypothetical protein WCA89_05410 [Terracidiphilus sp.]